MPGKHTGGQIHHAACLLCSYGGTIFHGQYMTTDRSDTFDKKREVIFIINTLADDAGTGTDSITKDIFTGCGYVTIADFIQNSTVVGRNQILIIINLL